jgi:hypothetical protein
MHDLLVYRFYHCANTAINALCHYCSLPLLRFESVPCKRPVGLPRAISVD